MFRDLGLSFEVIPAEIAEDRKEDEAPSLFARRMAEEKGRAVAEELEQQGRRPWIVSADTVVVLDGDFFRYLINQLSLATGPIAGVLIEDEVQALGYEVDQFPAYRAAELVDRLAGEIRREEKKTIFKNNMVSKIQQKGYLE